MVNIQRLSLLFGTILPAFAAPAEHRRPLSDGKYIITLKETADAASIQSHIAIVNRRGLNRRDLSGVDKVWSKHFKGYSGEFDSATLDEIFSDEEVLDIEPVQTWKLYAVETQSDAPWGLASISSGGATGESDYSYDDSAGEGGYAYVIDSGIYTDHEDFDGRASLGYNAMPSGEHDDSVGHGTHVAGTIIGTTYGVAKKAEAISVKVFGDGGSSTTDIIMDGFEWAVEDIIDQGREDSSVINMSLGGGFSAAFNRAVDQATSNGVLSVVAAGNEFADASDVSPASADSALTVGAIDETNTKPGFSNYGSVVDIFAPGVEIESAGVSGPSSTEVFDGTSMAAPHVAGLALYVMALEGTGGGEDAKDFIVSQGIEGELSSVGTGSPNLLAYNGVGDSSRNGTTKA